MAKRKPRNYWRKWENYEQEMQRIIDETGRFPTYSELNKRNSALVDATFRVYGGIREVRIKLGYEPNRRPDGYWKNFDNLKKEIDKFFQENPEHRELPSQGTFNRLGYSSLNLAIRMHGGYHKVRKKLGHKNGEKVGKGKWKSIEFTKEQARKIMKKHGFSVFPGEKFLRENGYVSICNAISRYHEGTNSFRKILGEEKTRRNSPGTWGSLEYTLGYARNFLNQHSEYESLPSADVLRQLGEHGFVTAIYDYHGGIRKFRELLEGITSKTRFEDTLEAYLGGRRNGN